MKNILSIGVLIIVVIILGYFLMTSKQPEPMGTEAAVGYSEQFFYDASTYTLIDIAKGDVPHDDFLRGYTILNTKEYEELQNSTEPREGPPAISILVFANNGRDAKVWVEEESFIANYQGTTLEEVTVNGVQGVAYTADGLYSSKVTVLATDTRVFFLSGAYISLSDPVVDEYNHILETFTVDEDALLGPEEQEVDSLALFFGKTLTTPVSPDGPIPIEGYDAGLLLGRYEGLAEADFNGVEALQGIYAYEDSTLSFTLTAQNEHSAARTIAPEGYETLLENIQNRLGVTYTTEAEISALVEAL